MNKVLLFLSLCFFSANLFAQCDELFISEYVEGYANNKALEIYNPTSQAIDLSEYSIARFSNGNTVAAPPSETPSYIVELPEVMLDPYDVFVIVLDKQDTTQWDSQFDKPVWNGYNLIDTLFDIVTGEPLLDNSGNIIYGPQYLDGAALFGSEYDEEYDLQCKADVFLCPVYDINRTMYFNGNDAVVLLKGNEVAEDGSNILDVIGVIGENPESTINEDAWLDENGFWLTKDNTMIRNEDVVSGRNDLNEVVFSLGGTFTGQEWTSYFKNDFQFLGIHNSVCEEANTNSGEYSCLTGEVVGTREINQIPFNMYPNPNATGVLTVESETQFQRVEIFNLLGQSVYREQIGTTNYKTEINLNDFKTGMYLVNLIFSENQVSVRKLVVE